jgi:tetrathionate reductase subunit A
VNLAFNAKVPDADPTEEAFVEQNYPESFISYARQILTPEEWRKFVYVVARGGVFEDPDSAFMNDLHKYGAKRLFHFWIEKLATVKHSITGKNFIGTATWVPARDMAGRELDEVDGAYTFTLVSYKMGIHTQSRTIYQKWALEIVPENYVEMNAEDADRLNLESGNLVVVRSASDALQGRLRVTNLLRPGVVSISYHYGHWAHGAGTAEVEQAENVVGVYTATPRAHLETSPETYIQGDRVMPDAKRGAGIWVNKVMRVDDTTNSPLVDPIAGSAPTSGVRVLVERLA